MRGICRRGELLALAEEYIASCSSEEQGVGDKKQKGRFPNLAGFARMLGVGVDDLCAVRREWPEQYGAMLALFEDEALNSDRSATVLNAYIKERLEFGETKEGGATNPIGTTGNIKVIFEHDISEDGA